MDARGQDDAWTRMLRAKSDVRAAMVARIRALSAPERQAAAERAAASLSQFLQGFALSGSIVALYASTATELDSGPAVRLLGERYQLAFPRVAGASLTFHLAAYESLTAHQSRVREPRPDDQLVTPDVVVAPARAYDRWGVRLGHGYGYYDHALAELPDGTLRVGLCHSFQVVERLPRAAHDRTVAWLVTDQDAPYPCRDEPFSDTMPALSPAERPGQSPSVAEDAAVEGKKGA